MKIITKLASLTAFALALTACVNEVDNGPVKPSTIEEVGFELCGEATRTSIDPDGVSTRWAEGDRMAVWAQDAAGNYALENTTFRFHHYSDEYDHGYFVANIASMADGDYTYMLAYPAPQSVSGTQATFSVSATQSGAYDGKYDIMIAEPAVADALSAERRVEINTIMRHQMHAVKITVPEGRNLYGTRFYRLEITFPNPVVGDITLDITNPDAEPVYSNMSNVVVLESAEGFDAGSVLWAFVLPGTVDGDVSYRVKGERRHSNVATYSLSKQMQKGRVTPINMAIPTIYPYYTAVTLSIEANNLGEDFNYFDVYDNNGNHMGRFTPNATNKYVVDYEGEFDADQYDNATWRLVYDSEHAIVEETVQFGDMTDYSEHFYSTEVPYLFYEDFSTLSTFDGDYTGGPYTSTSNASKAGRDLSQYGIAAGWTGARTGCDAAGTAILVSGRTDYVIAGATRAYGRLDSPSLSAIKPDKNVKVKVTFDYGGSRSGGSWAYAVAKAGYTTTQGILDGYATQFNNNAAFSGIDGAIDVPDIPTSGSASALTLSMSYNIDVCTSLHRLSWHIGSLGTTFIGNGYQWMYIDNVKVQIAQ